MDEEKKKFRPIKQLNWFVKKPHIEREFVESGSLYFNPEARRKAQKNMETKKEDLDQILKNIKLHIDNKGKRIENISPEIAHHIEKFENINDFAKPPNFENKVQQDQGGRRRKKRNNKKSLFSTQFGF